MRSRKRTSLIASLTSFIAALQLLSNGCSKDLAEAPVEDRKEECDTLYEGFAQNIDPIISSNCATSGCHDSNSPPNGIALETHAQIKDETKNGKLLCSIRHESGCSNMPSGQPQLDAEKIRLIECWKEKDYPND